MTSTRTTHSRLCFTRAFPESLAAHRDAGARLQAFESNLRDGPDDSGIAGTSVYYSFSYDVARWLARRAPGEVSIDWDAVDDTTRLDELLAQLLQPAEDEYFDSGYVSSREWIDAARGAAKGTDFDWLLAQITDKPKQAFWRQLYDAIDLPLVWDLRGSRYSKSANIFPVRRVHSRAGGMRPRPRRVKQAIQRPLESIRKLAPANGARLIDVAMASLAVRHRETNHFNFANADEVYLADVGAGIAIAVFGLQPEHRYPLECTMGYLILSNGVPVGYGGSSLLFRQVNTGINIFAEYRGGEASFLWVQVMRMYHALTGCTRFIANAYQFGADNIDALKSGAFWFYYRLGYRPVEPDIRKLAQRETSRIKRNRKYRSDSKTLRKLASCDMHLTLPGARAGELFDERWLETLSMLATRELGGTGCRTRKQAVGRVAEKLARDVGIRSLAQWSAAEHRGLKSIAPIVAIAAPGSWSAADKRSIRQLLRAKGGRTELRYARLLRGNERLLGSLKRRAGHEFR